MNDQTIKNQLTLFGFYNGVLFGNSVYIDIEQVGTCFYAQIELINEKRQINKRLINKSFGFLVNEVIENLKTTFENE